MQFKVHRTKSRITKVTWVTWTMVAGALALSVSLLSLSNPPPLSSSSLQTENYGGVKTALPIVKLTEVPTPEETEEQGLIVGEILNSEEFQNKKKISGKYCVFGQDQGNKDIKSSFEWVSQGDGTLPLGHMSGGIELKIGNMIATILYNMKEGGEENTKYFYDIGMNSGFFGLMAASLGFRIRAFDPQPMCHAYVEKSREANNFPRDRFQTHMIGLGDGGGGLVKPFLEIHVGACHGGYSWPDRWGGKMAKVPMHNLTDAVGNRHIAVMKMDTEGNEASILATGYDIFDKGQVDYLIVETKPKVWKRGIGDDPVLRIAKLAKRIVDIATNAEYTEWKAGNWQRDGDFLFEFVNKPVTDMRQVGYRQASGSSDC